MAQRGRDTIGQQQHHERDRPVPDRSDPPEREGGPLRRGGRQCKDDRMAERTKGVRHTCPEPLKGRGEARYFAPKGTQGKEGVRRKSKAEGLSAGDSPGSDRSARPEVRGAQDEGNESGIR